VSNDERARRVEPRRDREHRDERDEERDKREHDEDVHCTPEGFAQSPLLSPENH
jgi:hypothetical protein